MTVWNSADKSADITLSVSDRVATRNAGAAAWRAARGVSSFTIGTATKRYFEVEVTGLGGSSGFIAGVALSAASLESYIGSDNSGYGFQAVNAAQRNAYYSGTPVAYTSVPAIGVGERMMVALDVATGRLWFGTKGAWIGDPAAGTGYVYTVAAGTYFPGISLYDNPAGGRLYADGGYLYNRPSGFVSWDAEPVKVVALTLKDRNGAIRANLAGLQWAFFDQAQPGALAAPTAKGVVGATDAAGVLTLSVVGTALAAGATGFLVVSNTDGSVGDSIAFAAPVQVTV